MVSILKKDKPKGSGTSGKTVTAKVVPWAKSKVTVHSTPDRTTKTFIAGDLQGNKVNDRPTTPQVGKSLNENPAKTKARMDAQAAGKTEYDFKGKKEYSGRNHNFTLKGSTNVDITIPKTAMSTQRNRTNVAPMNKKSAAEIRQANGPAMKRRLPRVDWLKGRNKKTQSGHG
jgi:hypothetical protein